MRLQGKSAIITGSGRGIGKEIAIRFLAEGARVMLSDVMEGPLSETALELKSAGGTVEFTVCNVINSDDVGRLVETTVQKFGGLDILVNNAGITRDNLLLRMKEEEWDQVLDINLKGAFLCSKLSLKHILKSSGSIINISSIIGMMGNAGQCNYSASKAGLIGLTKSLAREIAKKGARVNAIAPGFIKTAMTDALPEQVKNEMLAAIPLGRFGSPSEIAAAAVFLAGEESKYITGQVLQINGGMYM
ncbi:MAG: 3-oxoacyl-ACP reductase FabG [Candidatus Wallbacteria bacterium]|nr:3-oxoacyl-ACP reductase FabG [Candidatus Wallbacteria bacterium]